MTNQPPLIPAPLGDDDDPTIADGTADDADGMLDPALEDDRPLDPDLDDDRIDSAAADERAATEGTLDVDDRP
ncbi:hypothetical protein JNB63_09775 [Microbacterium trichothecenolyticum]|jgi:hypothetical protein|uniref:Sugar ABC transporter ATPase n=1 Tax=Microbacterium ureisolvens TaxID=2781186 RepID=A0ABS7HY15_9MICO|nr:MULTISPECIES: hypothetical protein [Microbacterium]MBW9110277.1 hypothetical protein [Microbacterium ureisolvens]MBW9120383.1 hypothetical protein [Microbacterium trichothecenolyticum]